MPEKAAAPVQRKISPPSEAGDRIYPLSMYYIDGGPEKEQYILGFTKMQKEDMIKGLKAIREVYRLV